MVIPNTDQVIQATFLDDTEPDWKPGVSARATLAEWITARGNPFFARAAANRMWAYVFGTGIVEPMDDFTDESKPSHPELLADLSRAFADSGYDLRFLLKAMLIFLVLTWVRWSFVRIRVDHILAISWKLLLPASIVLLLATGLWVAARGPHGG